jgi:hypothetical protein
MEIDIIVAKNLQSFTLNDLRSLLVVNYSLNNQVDH